MLFTPLLALLTPLEHQASLSSLSLYQHEKYYHGIEACYSVSLNSPLFSYFFEPTWRQFYPGKFSSSIGAGVRPWVFSFPMGVNTFYDISNLSGILLHQTSIGLDFLFDHVDIAVNTYFPWPSPKMHKHLRVYTHTDIDILYKTPLFKMGISPYIMGSNLGMGFCLEFFYKNFDFSGLWKYDPVLHNSLQCGIGWKIGSPSLKKVTRNPFIPFTFQKKAIKKIETPFEPFEPLPVEEIEKVEEPIQQPPELPLEIIEPQPPENPPEPSPLDDPWEYIHWLWKDVDHGERDFSSPSPEPRDHDRADYISPEEGICNRDDLSDLSSSGLSPGRSEALSPISPFNPGSPSHSDHPRGEDYDEKKHIISP